MSDRDFLVRIPKRDDLEPNQVDRDKRIAASVNDSPSLFLLGAGVTLEQILACYHGWRKNEGLLNPSSYYRISEAELVRRQLPPQPRPDGFTHGWPAEIKQTHYEIDLQSRSDAERWIELVDASQAIPAPTPQVYFEILNWAAKKDANGDFVGRVKERFRRLVKMRLTKPDSTTAACPAIDQAIQCFGLTAS